MKSRIVLATLMMALAMVACAPTDDIDDYSGKLPEEEVQKTVFMYFPYSGNSGNLYSYFQMNIEDMEDAIVEMGGLDSVRVMVFIARTTELGYLYQVNYKNGACVHDTIQTYTEDIFNSRAMNSSSWIKYIINQVNSYAPCDSMALCIGCHGLGWLYGDTASVATRSVDTRWFGGLASKTDIDVLADGISSSSVGKMQYILFDDCYMSGIEAAYELKDVASYIIASPAEVNGNGMPYDLVFKYLVKETPDYASLASTYYDYYSDYLSEDMQYPFCQIAITDCSYLDDMAALVKEIYVNDSSVVAAFGNDTIANPSWVSDLQIYTHFRPTLFYDFGDYINHLCSSDSLLTEFNTLLDKLVPYKYTTEKGYSDLGLTGYFDVNTYSGLDCSEPSTSQLVWPYMKYTAWYKATR